MMDGRGEVLTFGGSVMKNVAGYDLAKLLTGSLGTLGVIVKAIFRLHPQPEAERLVEAEMRTPAEVGAAVQRLLHSILVPSALELFWPDYGSLGVDNGKSATKSQKFVSTGARCARSGAGCDSRLLGLRK